MPKDCYGSARFPIDDRTGLDRRFIASQFFKLDYAHNIGMLCGSMANPMALSYANTTVEGDEPSVSYATVYPLSMFIRVISAQLLIMLFT